MGRGGGGGGGRAAKVGGWRGGLVTSNGFNCEKKKKKMFELSTYELRSRSRGLSRLVDVGRRKRWNGLTV